MTLRPTSMASPCRRASNRRFERLCRQQIVRAHVHPAGRTGFSLLELLIAAMMFSIVVGAMSTVFFGAHRLQRTNENAVRDSHRIRVALDVLKRDLRSVTVPGTNTTAAVTTGDTNTVNRLSGQMVTGEGASAKDAGTFQFHTTSGLISDLLPWNEVQRVVYSLRAPEDPFSTNGLNLVRGVSRNLLPGLDTDYAEQVVLTGVETMQFQFWDGSTWNDYWDSSTFDPYTPKAIRAALLLMPNESEPRGRMIEVVVPVVVEPLTNVVQAASTPAGGGQ